MSWTKLTAYLEPFLAKGLSSIHLVNLSTATSKWVKPLGAFLKAPMGSNPPYGKGPCDGDSLELLGWRVDLSSKVLAPLARPHNLNCVGGGRWPIKALSEGFFDHAP
jgi:hypothetical protein